MNSCITIDERRALYFLQSLDTIGNITIQKLKQRFGCYEAVYKASDKEITGCGLLTHKMLDNYMFQRRTRDISCEYDKLNKKNIHYYLVDDEEYPQKLLELHDHPPGIFVNGTLPNPSIPSVAIIGARSCSNYGQAMAEEYTEAIVANGIQIISGMAMGIDGIAGRTALRNNGHSFAVLGCGPDVCYPHTNRDLFDGLSVSGGLISEYPPGTPGVGWHFPMRNRIIAALSDVLVVIEAKEKSGTMITVDSALELGREVYALPGRSSDALSRGCNLLIRQGAGILISPEEFVSDFIAVSSGNPEYANYYSTLADNTFLHRDVPVFTGPEEKIIYNSLDYNPLPIDCIYDKVNAQIPVTISGLMITLTNLTVKGLIVAVGGSNYALK